MQLEKLRHGTELLKRGFAKMQKGGVIMDVTNPQEAQIAERAGAVAVMALHAIPADIRKAGGVARMADPQVIAAIIDSVTIPVMAKARIGHFVEAEILEALGVDMVDESEVLTPADESFHIDKTRFTIPFVCGARDLGEALRRINEGAAMIRTKGEAGTGDVKEAVRHMRTIMGTIRKLKGKNPTLVRKIEAPIELVKETAELQRLPVVNFAAGGINMSIYGLEDAERIENVKVFHAGTKKEGKTIISDGGRVFGVTGYSPNNIEEARNIAYYAVSKINIGAVKAAPGGFAYRKDIAQKGL